MQTRAKSIYLFITGCILLFISCSSSDQSAGSQLSLDSFETIRPEPLFEFAESEEVVFENIQSMQADNYGNILVSDFGQHSVFVFNKNGDLIQRIGREGRGPNEFQRVHSFIVEGRQLLVLDATSKKIEEYEYRDGKYLHLETILLDESNRMRILLGAVDNRIIAKQTITFYAGSRDHPTEYALSLKDLNTDEYIEELVKVPVFEILTTVEGELLMAGKPFGRETLLAFDGQDRIYNLWSDSLGISYFTLDGKRHPGFHHKLTPVSITSEEQDSVLSDMYQPHRNEMRRQFPETKPMVNNLLVDDENRIWVELNTEELGLGWFAFTREGDPLLHVGIPDVDAELQDVHNGMILWNFTDEMGIPTIKAASLPDNK